MTRSGQYFQILSSCHLFSLFQSQLISNIIQFLHFSYKTRCCEATKFCNNVTPTFMSMKMANAEFSTKTCIFKNTVHLSQGQLFIKICINKQRSQQMFYTFVNNFLIWWIVNYTEYFPSVSCNEVHTTK